MELILYISLLFNGLFIGIILLGRYLKKKELREAQIEMEKAVSDFSRQYFDIYKDYMTHA